MSVSVAKLNKIVARMQASLSDKSQAISADEYTTVMKNLSRIPLSVRQRYVEAVVTRFNSNLEIIPDSETSNKNYGDRIESKLLRLPNNPLQIGDLLGMELKSLDIGRSQPLRLTTKNLAATILRYLGETRGQSRYGFDPIKYTDAIYYPSYPPHQSLCESDDIILNQQRLENHSPPLLAVTYPNYKCGTLDGKINRLKFDIQKNQLQIKVRPDYCRSSGMGGAYLTKDVGRLNFDIAELFSKFQNGFLLVLYKKFNAPRRGIQIQRVVYCSLKIPDIKRMLIKGEISINFRLKGGKKPMSTNDVFVMSFTDVKQRMHDSDGFEHTVGWRCPPLV